MDRKLANIVLAEMVSFLAVPFFSRRITLCHVGNDSQWKSSIRKFASSSDSYLSQVLQVFYHTPGLI